METIRADNWQQFIKDTPTRKAWEMEARVTAEHELAHALVFATFGVDNEIVLCEDDPCVGDTFFDGNDPSLDNATQMLVDVAGFTRERMLTDETGRKIMPWSLGDFFTASPFRGDLSSFVARGGNKKLLRACVEMLEPFLSEHEWFFAYFTPQVVRNGRVMGHELAHELERRARCR